VRTFQRTGDGGLMVTLHEGHITLLAMLLAEVRTLIEEPEAGNRATERLFPTAYLDPTEEDAEREWQASVHDELVRGKLAAFNDMRTLLKSGRPGPNGAVVLELDAEQEEHLLGSLNDMRLVLAELINGASEDAAGTDPEDAAGAQKGSGAIDTAALLEWLTDLVSELVDVKLADFPGE
jgi:Domain of unknown function (DUF2017)